MMDRILIRGGVPLSGTIPIGGAKNAALPLMAASLLPPSRWSWPTCPTSPISGRWPTCWCSTASRSSSPGDGAPGRTGPVLELSARHITSTTAPYDLVRKMRASVLVLGPLVARCGRGRVSLPGGCAIGTRPVDLHLKGLQRLGAEIELSEGYIEARAPNGLRGAEIRLPVRLGRRHREPADGGHPGRGRDGADQCRARARNHRSGALPSRDGRADRGHRHRPADDPRRLQPARRAPQGHPRPDRDRHLHDGGGGDRRRGAAGRRPARPCRRGAPHPRRRRGVRQRCGDGDFGAAAQRPARPASM